MTSHQWQFSVGSQGADPSSSLGTDSIPGQAAPSNLPAPGNRSAVSHIGGTLRGGPSLQTDSQGTPPGGVSSDSFGGWLQSAKSDGKETGAIMKDLKMLVAQGRPCGSKCRPSFKSSGLHRVTGRGRGGRTPTLPPSETALGSVRVISEANAAWSRGRSFSEAKNGRLAIHLTQALEEASYGGGLEVSVLQHALQNASSIVRMEMDGGQPRKRTTLVALGQCQDLLHAISASEQEARRMLQVLRHAEAEGWLHVNQDGLVAAKGKRLLQHLTGLEGFHQKLGRALAIALGNLGVGRTPCCGKGHAMDAVPLPSLDSFHVCNNCGRSTMELMNEIGSASTREPWWKCRLCCFDGSAFFYCIECGREVQRSSSYAKLYSLVPTENWRMAMSSFKGKGRCARPPSGAAVQQGPKGPKMEGGPNRFASRDLAETPQNTAEFEEERPSRPESNMSNGTATGKWTEKEVHFRLGAPSPMQNQSNSAFVPGFFPDDFEEAMAHVKPWVDDIANALPTFLTDDIDNASVVSTISTGRPVGEGFPNESSCFPEVRNRKPSQDASVPCAQPTRLPDSRGCSKQTLARRRERERMEGQIITRRPKLAISPGLENVLLGQMTNLTASKDGRSKERALSARRNSEAAEADVIAQELLEKLTRPTRSNSSAMTYVTKYAVAPKEMFDGSMKEMDLPIWEKVLANWQQRIDANELEAGEARNLTDLTPLPLPQHPRSLPPPRHGTRELMIGDDPKETPAVTPTPPIRAWSPAEWLREAGRRPWIDPDDILDYYFAR